MNYRENQKNNEKISLLAFGCMRFPKDFAAAESLILTAIDAGINYFDTAYIYPGSEAALGRIISKHDIRHKINIATKLPTFLVKKASDFDKYFNIQLDRLQTNYIDYYLMHMLISPKSWERLVALGIEDWLAEKKKSGRIKNVGFSFHGGADDYKTLVDAYDWEFTMIQYNYIDVNNQAGRSGLLYAAEKGIPVMIMEPLRGGRLVYKLPEKVKELLGDLKPERHPADWAFRWIYSHKEVLTVLSGMESLKVLQQNIETASDEDSYELTAEQDEAIAKARELIAEMTEIPCTGCGYCMPCKAGVDIPLCFAQYNDIKLHGRNQAFMNYASRAGSRRASLCTGCKSCMGRCPQDIDIVNKLKHVRKKMEGGVYKPVGAIIRKFMKST
jgi:hypothetical protein